MNSSGMGLRSTCGKQRHGTENLNGTRSLMIAGKFLANFGKSAKNPGFNAVFGLGWERLWPFDFDL
jgi:hypothetical protein